MEKFLEIKKEYDSFNSEDKFKADEKIRLLQKKMQQYGL